MKQLCIIYANCQNRLIATYLQRSHYFNQKYIIRRFPVHLLIARNKNIPDRELQQAKLFIYQPVKDIHGKHSTNYIISKLPKDCRLISFPSLYFLGYFPQFCKNPVNHIIEPNHCAGVIPHGDTNIISMLERGKSTPEIIRELSNPDFYTSEFLQSNLNKTLAELRKRELQLDVKISDFIKNNFQNYYLFYTQNHPTDLVGMWVVNQILKLLKLPTLNNPLSLEDPRRGILDQIQIPIYPSVIKHLSLKFVERNSTYKHYAFSSYEVTFERYITGYIELHKLLPKSASAYYLKALKLLNRNNYELARSTVDKAIELKPKNATYYGELGNILQKQNDLEAAEKAL